MEAKYYNYYATKAAVSYVRLQTCYRARKICNSVYTDMVNVMPVVCAFPIHKIVWPRGRW